MGGIRACIDRCGAVEAQKWSAISYNIIALPSNSMPINAHDLYKQ